MVMKDKGEIVTDDESGTNSMIPLEDVVKEIGPAQGELLVTRRTLSLQANEEEEEEEEVQ